MNLAKWTTAGSVLLFVVWMQRHHRWALLRTAMAGKLAVVGGVDASSTKAKHG